MLIVELFYNLAREHKNIKSFVYGKNYTKGAGNTIYPTVWLDDPILCKVNKNVALYTANVDFLAIPELDRQAVWAQKEMLKIGLDFSEQIKKTRAVSGVSIDYFSFITLRDYYDDKAAGARFTFNLIAPNPANICEDEFDPEKEFERREGLPIFSVYGSDGCAVFSDKKGLPKFDI